MKKKILLISTLTSAVLISALAFAGLNQSNNFVRGDDDNHNHTIIFGKADLTHGEYDSDYSCYYIDLYQAESIVVNEHEKYDFESSNGESYVTGDKSDINFESFDYLIECTNYCGVYFEFAVIERAAFDVTKSNVLVHNITQGNDSAEKFTYSNTENGFDYYYCYVDTYSAGDYGDSFGIVNVKIVFSC